MKLTTEHLSLMKVVRAELTEKNMPCIYLKILAPEVVKRFVESPSKGYLWGGVTKLGSCRLQYTITDDVLCITRSTTPITSPFVANLALAQYTLQFILQADVETFMSIWEGLTTRNGWPIPDFRTTVPRFIRRWEKKYPTNVVESA